MADGLNVTNSNCSSCKWLATNAPSARIQIRKRGTTKLWLVMWFLAILWFQFPVTNAAAQDYEWNVCWDIPLTDDTLFCLGAVNWKLSESVYNDVKARDDKAKAAYNEVLARWRTNPNDESVNPTSHCLAIARSVLWAYHIPSWGGVGREQEPLWKFVCSLWEARCPEENQSIWDIVSSEDTWSYAYVYNPIVTLLQVTAIFLVFLINL